jgi:hypothetical protein
MRYSVTVILDSGLESSRSSPFVRLFTPRILQTLLRSGTE